MARRDLTKAFDAAGARRRLLRWYIRHKRDLPWRRTSEPYRVWLSEIMLQQTRVETVIPYYENFLRRFSSLGALARAPEERVLAAWSGLGYYSRAKNLRRAARVILADHAGEFPRDEQSALALPGVGDYTAAAVLSIAYGVPLAVLDGNVARVLSRLHTLSADMRDSRGRAALWERAQDFLDRDRAGDFNQAMMELGATVCLPGKPRCDRCPLHLDCRAHQAGLEDDFPPVRARVAETAIQLVGAVVRDPAGRYLLERRPGDAGWMGGFWEIPMWSVAGISDASAAYGSKVRERIELGRPLGSVRHSITRFRIEVKVREAELVDQGRSLRPTRDLRWASGTALLELPVTTITRKAIRLQQAGAREAR